MSEYDHKLRCVSVNTQKSGPNMRIVLETYQTYDIVQVQEHFWGFIKHVVTSVNASGVPYGSMGFNPGAAAWSSKSVCRFFKICSSASNL